MDGLTEHGEGPQIKVTEHKVTVATKMLQPAISVHKGKLFPHFEDG